MVWAIWIYVVFVCLVEVTESESIEQDLFYPVLSVYSLNKSTDLLPGRNALSSSKYACTSKEVRCIGEEPKSANMILLRYENENWRKRAHKVTMISWGHDSWPWEPLVAPGRYPSFWAAWRWWIGSHARYVVHTKSILGLVSGLHRATWIKGYIDGIWDGIFWIFWLGQTWVPSWSEYSGVLNEFSPFSNK